MSLKILSYIESEILSFGLKNLKLNLTLKRYPKAAYDIHFGPFFPRTYTANKRRTLKKIDQSQRI